MQVFERNLEDNLFKMHYQLKTKTYQHGQYHSFYVQDPKQRHIHKAQVSDRIIHHLLYKYLYGIFDKIFIYDSYSCRLGKGIHKGVKRLECFTRKISKNYTQSCWALKLDIKKFFSCVDHQILLDLLKGKIKDQDTLWLLKEVIESFPRGIPLGNLTSQIFANIYLNKLDQFVKHSLKAEYYLRYADDFILLSCSNDLNQHIKSIKCFLRDQLKLSLHPQKIILRKLTWGIDFLGYIVLPHHILPRTKTRKRIFKKLTGKIDQSVNLNQTLQSYLGYLSHANSFKLAEELKNLVYVKYEF